MRSLLAILSLLAVIGCASTQHDDGGLVQDHASTVDRGGVGNYLFPKQYYGEEMESEEEYAGEDTAAAEDEELWNSVQSSPTWQPSAELVDDKIEISDEIRFEHGSAKLTADSERILDDVAAVILNNQDTVSKVEVAGHTDSTGTRTRNLKLSEQRAKSVRDYLVSKGVSDEMLMARGYGDTEPKYDPDNASAEELAQNRRVEFRIESADREENLAE